LPSKLGQSAAITCTRTELVALVGLLEGTAVHGIEDPLRGLSEREIDTALVKAREGLERRHYLRLAADGFIELDGGVASVVQVVAHPERSYFVYLTHGSARDPIEAGTRRVFHVKGDLAVEVADGDEPMLTALDGRDGIATAVTRFWHVEDQPAAGSERVHVAQQALHQAARIAASEGRAACLESLRAAGVPPTAASTLAETLTSPRSNAAVIAFSIEAPAKSTVAIGALEGANGLWRMRAAADEVDLEPTTGAALARLIREFVRTA